MVRDEIERTNISFYEDQLIQCMQQNHAKYTSNVYTKIFSGPWPFATPNERLNLYQSIDYNPELIVDRVYYEMAVSILKDFDVVLILEQYDQTKMQLKCNGIMNDTLP